MARLVTITYNNNAILTNLVLNNSTIIYNDNIIKSNFLGTALVACNANVMRTNLNIGNIILLSCSDKEMLSNIVISSTLPQI